LRFPRVETRLKPWAGSYSHFGFGQLAVSNVQTPGALRAEAPWAIEGPEIFVAPTFSKFPNYARKEIEDEDELKDDDWSIGFANPA
jgi:hypothetical protein